MICPKCGKEFINRSYSQLCPPCDCGLCGNQITILPSVQDGWLAGQGMSQFEEMIRKDERNIVMDKVVKILNNGIDTLEELQVDGYSSTTIIAKRDVIEYLLEKIIKLREGKRDGELG